MANTQETAVTTIKKKGASGHVDSTTKSRSRTLLSPCFSLALATRCVLILPQGLAKKQSQDSRRAQLIVPQEERHPVLATGRESTDPHLHPADQWNRDGSRQFPNTRELDTFRHFWTPFWGVHCGRPTSQPYRPCLTYKAPLIPRNNLKPLGGPNSSFPRKNATPYLIRGGSPQTLTFIRRTNGIVMVRDSFPIRENWTLLDTFGHLFGVSTAAGLPLRRTACVSPTSQHSSPAAISKPLTCPTHRSPGRTSPRT